MILGHSGSGPDESERTPAPPQAAGTEPVLPGETTGEGTARTDACTARDGDRKTSLPRRRVLVVDDNVDAATSLAKLLTILCGQEVRVAYDGPSAEKLALEFRPEIALLDLGLPGMD